MNLPKLTLVVTDYDFIAPLALGDVKAEGLDLRVERENAANAIDRPMSDPTVVAGEISFARHVARIAASDPSWVGIPFFLRRGFRHRTFYVRRGSPTRNFGDLDGKRIGVADWPATGNTWGRAVLRDHGVEINHVKWMLGTIDGAPSKRPHGTLPPFVQPVPAGRALRDLLINGEVDALMWGFEPKGFYDPESPIVRLVPDFRRVEQDYYRRTGIYPGLHLLGIRREVFDRDPGMARSLYSAVDRSKTLWQKNRLYLAETTPWMLADIEETTALMGKDLNPSGLEPNRTMIQKFCDELFAQGLAPRRVDATEVFSEMERVAGS
jgi:4,5-dihydroxyphthalate decarboxylase